MHADSSSLVFHFLLKEWKNETWFSQTFSFCVELSLVDIQDKTLAKTDQCGQKKLGGEDADFESLSKAVGTVIGRLINDH